MLFFFNNTWSTEIYPLSLHDALPISSPRTRARRGGVPVNRSTGKERTISAVHTTARRTPSSIGGASTATQNRPSGRLASRKPVAPITPAGDGGRKGPTEPWSGSVLGPAAVGADTRCNLSRAWGIAATLPPII